MQLKLSWTYSTFQRYFTMDPQNPFPTGLPNINRMGHTGFLIDQISDTMLLINRYIYILRHISEAMLALKSLNCFE